MNVPDCIIDGLEAELELQRELGVRFVECDRSLLKPLASAASASSADVSPVPAPAAPAPAPAAAAAPAPSAPSSAEASAVMAPRAGTFDFVFLHHRPLAGAGAEMIAKITAAMKRSPDAAPVVTAAPLPRARIYVVLGGNALKKFFPGMRGAPGQWLATATGSQVLVTYSPEYILRFGADSPGVKKIKGDMWLSLKTVMQRLG